MPHNTIYGGWDKVDGVRSFLHFSVSLPSRKNCLQEMLYNVLISILGKEGENQLCHTCKYMLPRTKAKRKHKPLSTICVITFLLNSPKAVFIASPPTIFCSSSPNTWH